MEIVNRIRVEVARDGVISMYRITNKSGEIVWHRCAEYSKYNGLPNWIQEGIAMLDLASMDHGLLASVKIEGIGFIVKSTCIYYLDHKGEI